MRFITSANRLFLFLTGTGLIGIPKNFLRAQQHMWTKKRNDDLIKVVKSTKGLWHNPRIVTKSWSCLTFGLILKVLIVLFVFYVWFHFNSAQIVNSVCTIIKSRSGADTKKKKRMVSKKKSPHKQMATNVHRVPTIISFLKFHTSYSHSTLTVLLKLTG